MYSFLLPTELVLTPFFQADHLEMMIRDQSIVQERMDLHLDSLSEEVHQLHSHSQEDGARMAALSAQLQEVISSVEARSDVVGRDLEEVNGWFDHYRGEINCLKEREKEVRDPIIGAAHEAELFKTCLDCTEDRVCRCRHTPSEVGEEFVSSEEEARTELSYALAKESEYIAPPVENPIPIPVSVPCLPCSSSGTCPALEEIIEEPRNAICDNLDTLLREAEVGRVRDLQEESSNLVVHPPPQVGSERWRRLNGILWMCPGPGRRDQRDTRSRPYVRIPSSRCPTELQGPGEPGRRSAYPPSSFLGAINSTLLWGAEEFPPSRFEQTGLVLQGEEFVPTPYRELCLWICNPPEDSLEQ